MRVFKIVIFIDDFVLVMMTYEQRFYLINPDSSIYQIKGGTNNIIINGNKGG